VGQKVSAAGVVSTYSLVYTTSTGAYWGGVLAPNGDIHFVPSRAYVGQKVKSNGDREIYALPGVALEANFENGVLAQNGDVVFLPVYTIGTSRSIGARLSTTIATSDIRGKTFRKKITLVADAVNIQNLNVYANAVVDPQYSAGFSDIDLIITPRTVISSNNTLAPALYVPAQFSPTDNVSIYNYGFIRGKGGDGGSFVQSIPTGRPGGDAIATHRPLTIQNVGTIGGGGGGGGQGGTITPRPAKQGGPLTQRFGGGGGGAGGPTSPSTNGGSGGIGGPGTPSTPGSSGPSSSTTTGGAGGGGTVSGGAGGGIGKNGASGFGSLGTGGGAPGKYLTGEPITTFTQTGTQLGGAS
jgi:hypothetical protein